MSTELATMPQIKSSGVIDVVRHLREIWDLADILVRSRMIPSSINTPEAAAAIILKGHELGIGPMQSFDSISVIQGKPTISPQLMLALIERSGLLEDMAVQETADSCEVTLKRRGRTPQAVRFDRAEAVSMGLAGKDNWKKQFGVMMYWRCVAKGCRRVFPDVIAGCYTPEEMGAEVSEDGEVIEAEVVTHDGEVIAPPPSPTGRGSGLMTKEHVEKTEKFNRWVSKKCDEINAKWRDEWDHRFNGAMAEGHAVPDKVPDVINPWGFKGHLVKWAVETERLDPAIVPEDVKVRQNDALCALVFFRCDEDKAAVIAEMSRYLQEQRSRRSDVVYRKFPDLAPEGWAEEQQEAAEHGDAYEGPDSLAESHDSADPAEAGKGA